jgi:hypothetical protein
LERLTQALVQQEQKAVARLCAVAKERRRILARLPQVATDSRPKGKWREHRLSLPGAGTAARLAKTDLPPKLPRFPQLETKALPPQEPVKPPRLHHPTDKAVPRDRPAARRDNRDKPRRDLSPKDRDKVPQDRRPSLRPKDRDKSPNDKRPPLPPRDRDKSRKDTKPPVRPKTGGKPPADGRSGQPTTKPSDSKMGKTGSGAKKP